LILVLPRAGGKKPSPHFLFCLDRIMFSRPPEPPSGEADAAYCTWSPPQGAGRPISERNLRAPLAGIADRRATSRRVLHRRRPLPCGTGDTPQSERAPPSDPPPPPPTSSITTPESLYLLADVERPGGTHCVRSTRSSSKRFTRSFRPKRGGTSGDPRLRTASPPCCTQAAFSGLAGSATPAAAGLKVARFSWRRGTRAAPAQGPHHPRGRDRRIAHEFSNPPRSPSSIGRSRIVDGRVKEGRLRLTIGGTRRGP